MQQVTPTEEYHPGVFTTHNLSYKVPSTPGATPDGTPKPTNVTIVHSTKQLRLINQIATILSALTSKFSNHRINNSKQHLIPFVTEVFRRSKCTKKVILLSMYYFHKLHTFKLKSITNLPEFSRCAKRIYLSCLVIAHKFLNDQTFSMKTWQCISGLSSKDITTMERWCLGKLEYELLLDDDKLNMWVRNVLQKDSVNCVLVTMSKKRSRDVDADLEWYPRSKRTNCIY
ncbi:LAFE_0A04060g1_1 [Lachancea fermentati]|uniref:LAFE_0A04060g1_1 n=1 Tax=Lachancea fermentati TaxID=4955 RepID=A0A1G4M6L6_LACFM|nr:LAFE_0A04060g1_1 [Lachancea fermentati]